MPAVGCSSFLSTIRDVLQHGYGCDALVEDRSIIVVAPSIKEGEEDQVDFPGIELPPARRSLTGWRVDLNDVMVRDVVGRGIVMGGKVVEWPPKAGCQVRDQSVV